MALREFGQKVTQRARATTVYRDLVTFGVCQDDRPDSPPHGRWWDSSFARDFVVILIVKRDQGGHDDFLSTGFLCYLLLNPA